MNSQLHNKKFWTDLIHKAYIYIALTFSPIILVMLILYLTHRVVCSAAAWLVIGLNLPCFEKFFICSHKL